VTRVVLASGNPGKLRELAALLAPLSVSLIPQAELGITAVPETGATFLANALLKARHAAASARLPALADDSGLEVDALGGRPGVASARYGGPGLTDAERVTRLLAEVETAPARGARFRCVLALVAPWGEEAVVEGVVEGVLAARPRGTQGFGYDPIFLVPALGRTFGELPDVEKHRLSHRARAADAARPILARWAARLRQPA